MQFTTFAATALLAASASAYQILSPSGNTTIAKGSDLTINWSSVDTDADVFSVYISNFETKHWPPTILSLAQNVPRDDGSVSVRIPCDLSSDFGWQINFINGTNTYVIYAQSARFSLTGDCVDPTTTAAPFPIPTSNTTIVLPGTTIVQHATVTATVTKAVSTVIIATPIVWVVEPSKAGGCANQVTVTAYPSTCEAKPTGPVYPGGPGAPGGPGGKPTTTKGPGSPTGTGGYSPTSPPQFTGAASSVQVSGALAAVVGAFALLL